MTFRRLYFLGLLALAAVHAVQNSPGEGPVDQAGQLAFRIEDTHSRVGLFAVKLSVGLLTQKDGKLVGDYVMEVPLFESKGDHGHIVLPIEMPLERIGVEGGTLTGEGHSGKKPGEVHKIVCKILPLKDKGIELAITTPKRTVHFTSSYKLIETE